MSKKLKLRALDGDGVMVYNVENPFDYIRHGYPVMEYTNITDVDKNEIYADDLLEDDENIYQVVWNSCQSSWWIEPRVSKVKNDYIIVILSSQRLGNGYLSRRDLKKIGNIHENPYLINDSIDITNSSAVEK